MRWLVLSLAALMVGSCGDTMTDQAVTTDMSDVALAEIVVDMSLLDAIVDSHVAYNWPEQPVPDAQVDAIVPACSPYGHRRECEIGHSAGPCSIGFEICLSSNWSECQQSTHPRRETCDGQDNDCDGVTDEADGVALSRPCYSGPAGTTKVGTCRSGVSTCSSGEFGPCVGERTPADEECDLADNDCDGVIDEGVTNACGLCGEPPEELCDFADNDCDGVVDEGAGNCECDNPLYVPQPEECNGFDEDCDGSIDEGDAGGPLVMLCSTRDDGVVQVFADPEDAPRQAGGQCRPGVSICEPEIIEGQDVHGFHECVQEIRPSIERCNGRDDDCDGLIDEAFDRGRVGVLFVVDVSGSMEIGEIVEAFVETQQAIEDLDRRGIADVCFSMAIVGSDPMIDPMLYRPANECVPGIQRPPANPRVDLSVALASLRARIDAGTIPRGGAAENTLDATGDWLVDDLVDYDEDGALDNPTWWSDDGEETGVRLELTPHRIAVILGDEMAQGRRWDSEAVAGAMRASGGIVYVLGPGDSAPAVAASYGPLTAAGATYLEMRGVNGREVGAIAGGIRRAIDEMECLLGR